jgi:hypothetical protein
MEAVDVPTYHYMKQYARWMTATYASLLFVLHVKPP